MLWESLFFILDLNPPSTLLDVSPLPLRGIPPSGGICHKLSPLFAGCLQPHLSVPESCGKAAGWGSSQRTRAPVKGRRRSRGVTYRGRRAGLDHKSKTTNPKVAGGPLPPGCRCPNMRRGSRPACIFGRLPLLRLACFCRRQRLGCAAPSGPAQRPSGRKGRTALKAKAQSLYFNYDLYPPGCGALFLLRGSRPACKKQTAAPAPPRLFLPQAAARLRSPPYPSGRFAKNKRCCGHPFIG